MGLNKPIIITSSSVDISNLATKSDIDTLKNGLGGTVKSIQRCVVGRANCEEKEQNNFMGNTYAYYKDITISPVDPEKCIVNFVNFSDAEPLKHIYNLFTDKVRVYCKTSANSNYTSYVMQAATIEIIEYE